MALEIEFEDNYGVTHKAAYARINKVIIENPADGQKNVTAEVCIYVTEDARDAEKAPVWGPQAYPVQKPAEVQPKAPEGEPEPQVVMVCAVDPDKATVADVYTWLKNQDAYKESKDV